MAYTRTTWETSVTPLSAANMNNIEDGIGEAKDAIALLQTAVDQILGRIYPVGSIYMSVNDTDPSTIYGGTWEQIKDRFLLASGDTYENGATGGSATVTLTTNQMPSHTHTQNAHNHTFTGTQHRHNPAGADNYVPYATGSKRSWRAIAQGGYQWSPGVWDTNTGGWAINTGYATAGGTIANTTATNKNAGGGEAHENMPPYMVVYVWKRIA